MLLARLCGLYKKLAVVRVTALLILCNISVYLYAGYQDTRAFEGLGHHSFLIDWGANVPALTLSGEYWRLFTSMFLHTSFLHLVVNMVALWSIGLILEARIRWPVFLGIYLLAGLCGSVATTLWNQDALLISCGASGAVLGMFGVLLIYSFIDKSAARPRVSLSSVAISLVLTLSAGAFFDLDNAAHLGGLGAGVVLGLLVFYSERLGGWIRVVILTSIALASTGALAGVMAEVHDADMREQIAVARFKETLGSMGLLNADSALTGSLSLDNCIEFALGETTHSDQTNAALRECNTKETEQHQVLLHTFMPVIYQRCQGQVDQLSTAFTDPATSVALKAIGQYCDIHNSLYGIVFEDKTVDLDVDNVKKMRLLTRFLLSKNGVYRTESKPLKAQRAAIKTLLARPGLLASSVVQASGCPYWSCDR